MEAEKSLYIHELFIAFGAGGQGGVRGKNKKKNGTEIGKNISDNIAHTLSILDTSTE